MTGRMDNSSPTTTMRVRNFDPSTPRRRSANNFSRLRANTNVSATNSRKTTAERVAKKRSCWLVSGLRNGRSNEVCDRTIPKTSKRATANRMIVLLRRDRSLETRVEVRGDTQFCARTNEPENLDCASLRPNYSQRSRGKYLAVRSYELGEWWRLTPDCSIRLGKNLPSGHSAHRGFDFRQ